MHGGRDNGTTSLPTHLVDPLVDDETDLKETNQKPSAVVAPLSASRCRRPHHVLRTGLVRDHEGITAKGDFELCNPGRSRRYIAGSIIIT